MYQSGCPGILGCWVVFEQHPLLIWDTWLGQRARSYEPDLLYFTKGISGLMVLSFTGQCTQVLIYVNKTRLDSHWLHCLLAETCHLFIIMSNVFEKIVDISNTLGKDSNTNTVIHQEIRLINLFIQILSS